MKTPQLIKEITKTISEKPKTIINLLFRRTLNGALDSLRLADE